MGATTAGPNWSTVAFLSVLVGATVVVLRANGIMVRYWRSRLPKVAPVGWIPSVDYWAEHRGSAATLELGHNWRSAADPDSLWSLCWDRGRLVADRRPALPPPVAQGVFGEQMALGAGPQAEMALRRKTAVVALGIPRLALDELRTELYDWCEAEGGVEDLLDALEERYDARRTAAASVT